MEFLVTLPVNKHALLGSELAQLKIIYFMDSTSHLPNIYCNITAHPVDFFPLYTHNSIGGKSELFLSQKMLDKGLKVKMEKNSIGLEFSQNLNAKTS